LQEAIDPSVRRIQFPNLYFFPSSITYCLDAFQFTLSASIDECFLHAPTCDISGSSNAICQDKLLHAPSAWKAMFMDMRYQIPQAGGYLM
jgi:hypothetical protein